MREAPLPVIKSKEMMDSSAPPGGGAREAYLAQQGGLSPRWIWLSILAIVIVAGYFLLTRLGGALSPSARATAAARPGVPVSATEVKRGDLNRYLTAIGTVTAFNTVTVKTRVDGQIVNIAFKEGQTVASGRSAGGNRSASLQATGSGQGQLAKDRPRCATRKSLWNAIVRYTSKE